MWCCLVCIFVSRILIGMEGGMNSRGCSIWCSENCLLDLLNLCFSVKFLRCIKLIGVFSVLLKIGNCVNLFLWNIFISLVCVIVMGIEVMFILGMVIFLICMWCRLIILWVWVFGLLVCWGFVILFIFVGLIVLRMWWKNLLFLLNFGILFCVFCVVIEDLLVLLFIVFF